MPVADTARYAASINPAGLNSLRFAGSLQLADHAEFVGTYFVTPNFFATFGVAPAFGRGYESQGSQGHENAPRGAVVGLSFAQRNFSSGAAALGQTLRMEGVAPTRSSAWFPQAFASPEKRRSGWRAPRIPRNHGV